MSFEKVYDDFCKRDLHIQQFYDLVSQTKSLRVEHDITIKDLSYFKGVDYTFLATNVAAIHARLDGLLFALEKIENTLHVYSELLTYNKLLACRIQAYFLCGLLLAYYNMTGDTKNQKHYGDLLIKLQLSAVSNDRITNISEKDQQRTLYKDLYYLLYVVPFSWKLTSTWLGQIHMSRLVVIFSRLMDTQIINTLHDAKWLANLETYLGYGVDPKILEVVSPLFNFLSVAVLATRFSLSAYAALHHAAYPAPREKFSDDYWENFWFILKQEMSERYWLMVNDGGWAILNFLCNYAPYLGIPAPLAVGILAVGLLGDVLWMWHLRTVKWNSCKTDINGFETKLNALNAIDINAEPTRSIFARQDAKENKTLDIDMLKLQKAHVIIKQQSTDATLAFYATAAGLFVSAFSASLLLASSASAVAVCYAVCTVGCAMYISGDKCAEYQQECQSRLVLKELGLFCGNRPSKKETQARDALYMSIGVKATVPALVLATYTISLPVALLLTAAYLGYECNWSAYRPGACELVSYSN